MSGPVYAVPLESGANPRDPRAGNAVAAGVAAADYAVPMDLGQIYQEPDGGVAYASTA